MIPYKKILVIRMSSIGDIVVCSPVLRCLKSQSDAEIHYLVKENFNAVVADNPHIDKIHFLKKRTRDTVRDLRRENFDLIIDLHKNLRSSHILIGLRKKFVRYNKLGIKKLLWTKFHINRLPKKHLVDRYFDSLSKIGLINDGLGLEFFYSQKASEDAGHFIKKNKLTSFTVLVLGAAHFTKRIPEILARNILAKSDKKFILIGGPDELDIASRLSKKENVFSACGELSIQASAAIIDRCEYVITGDTGMMHIAAALKKPIHMIWGSTHMSFGMFPYYGEEESRSTDFAIELNCRPCTKIGNQTCPKGHFKCMLDQQPELIVQALNEGPTNNVNHSIK